MTTPKPKVKPATQAAIDKLNRKPASVPTAKAAQPDADLRRIKILVKECPYRAETKAAATWALLIKAGTVGKFFELAALHPKTVDKNYLRYAWRDSFIEVQS